MPARPGVLLGNRRSAGAAFAFRTDVLGQAFPWTNQFERGITFARVRLSDTDWGLFFGGE